MQKGITAAIALAILLFGCVYLPAPDKSEPLPQINQTFATKEVRPNDIWKVYINASDPSGNMNRIMARLEVSGIAGAPVSYTKVKKGDEKELSGYLYFETSSAGEALSYRTLTLTVQIQNKAGEYSNPAVFTMSFNPQAVRQNPPPGIFKEYELGPVMTHITIPGRS